MWILATLDRETFPKVCTFFMKIPKIQVSN
jgi:hypothetical protein